MSLRVNATVEAALPHLERYAQLSNEVALIEANREKALADINATADGLMASPIEEMAKLREQAEAWWTRNGSALTFGKRKSIELGGCMIGTKTARGKLSMPGDDKAAASALQAHKWARPYVRVTVSVDKVATSKALEGKHGEQLRKLGFAMTDASETFTLERVEQAGTIAR